MRKKIFSLLLCSCFLGVTACGASDSVSSEDATIDVQSIIENANTDTTEDGKTILSIYAQYADDDTKIPYDYAVEQLAEAYPNVELNLIIQSQDDGATLKLLAEAGQLPDIYQANTSVITALKDDGNVMVLDDVAQSSGYLDKLYDSCQDLVYDSDGHIYCFPYAGNEYVMWYYNKALFDQCGLSVPTTYDELMNCVKVFKANGITPLETWKEGWITTACYDVFATRYENSGILGLDTGTTSISDAAYLSAANTMKSFVDAGLFNSDVADTDYDTAAANFLEGRAAMFLSGQWFISEAQEKMGSNVDWMYYPSYDADSYQANMYAFSGGGSTSGYAVNAKSKNAELAAEVAEFICEKYCEAKVMYRGNTLVALDTGATSETIESTDEATGETVEIEASLPAMMQKLTDTVPLMTSTTKFTWGLSNSTFNDSIMTATLDMLSGNVSAEQFISEISQ